MRTVGRRPVVLEHEIVAAMLVIVNSSLTFLAHSLICWHALATMLCAILYVCYEQWSSGSNRVNNVTEMASL